MCELTIHEAFAELGVCRAIDPPMLPLEKLDSTHSIMQTQQQCNIAIPSSTLMQAHKRSAFMVDEMGLWCAKR